MQCGRPSLLCFARSFLSYLQKTFGQSTQAQDEWFDVTGATWPTYSETRWFSKYDVMEKIFRLFPDILTVITRVTKKEVSTANSSKLLKLLLDPVNKWKLQIQLSSYVEALSPSATCATGLR